MKINRTIAIALLGTVLASGAQAVTFNINLVSIGTVAFGGLVTYNENMFFQWTSIPEPLFATNNYSIVNAIPPTPGTGTFSDLAATEVLNYDLVLESVTFSGNVLSGDGTWVYTNGVGSYADLSGGGTFSFSIDTTTSASYSTYVGTLATVPEPTSFALLGIGVAAIVRRRTKNKSN